MNRSLAFLPLLVLVVVVGCQRGEKLHFANVKGKVNYNGSPLPKGQITFTAEGQPPAIMQIVDGAFNGQAVVGSNRVAISAMKKAANPPKLSAAAQIQMKGYMEKFSRSKDEKGFTQNEPMVEYIPPEWGARSKETRGVEAGSANEFEFNVTGKK
jgi:hypothetical protein